MDEPKPFDLHRKVSAMVTKFPGVEEIEKHKLPAFTIERRLFLLCTPNSIIPTYLTPEEAEKAYRMYGARPFTIKGKECRDWPEIVVRDTNELRAVEFLIHASLKWARLDD